MVHVPEAAFLLRHQDWELPSAVSDSLSSNEHFYLWDKETLVSISYQASYTLHMALSLECQGAVWSLVQALMFTHFTSYI